MIDMIREASRVYQQNLRARDMGLPAALSLDEWLETIHQFDGLCAYCLEVPFDTMDHLVPMTLNGGTTADNCVPACEGCNSQKGRRGICDLSDQTSFTEKIEQVRYVLQNHIRIADLKRQREVSQDTSIGTRYPLDVLATMKQLAEAH